MSVGLLVVRLLYRFYVCVHLSKWFTFSQFLVVCLWLHCRLLGLLLTVSGLAFGGLYCSSRSITPNVLLKILNKISGSKNISRQRPKCLLAAITCVRPLTPLTRVSSLAVAHSCVQVSVRINVVNLL